MLENGTLHEYPQDQIYQFVWNKEASIKLWEDNDKREDG